jgi:SAM-dependent MidA family methyltransferase
MESWEDAWQRALYGPAGFYRREWPADHFRTSVHASALFATAVLRLVRERGLPSVTDVGAGGGELLAALSRQGPDLRLLGVDLRPRPSHLPPQVEWSSELPARLTGLVLANELLDNVPCPVVELDDDGVLRTLLVGDAGVERLGAPAAPEHAAWCETWWPLTRAGDRAEVGLPREDWWEQVCERTSEGLCLAVDFGHVRKSRPAGGTLTAYQGGRIVQAIPDGARDLTAHVAVDALAARVGGRLLRQRDALAELGVVGARPPREQAVGDPAGYLRALARASEAAELTATPGLGDFWWLLTPCP